MGYISNDDKKKKKNPEALEGGRAEKELTPEEKAALDQKAAEWQETLGTTEEPASDFSKAMADVPEFGSTTEAESEPAVAEAIEEVEKANQTEDVESSENETGVENADNEDQRTIDTVTEKVAREQVESNDIDVSNLVQNVAGSTAGGQETIQQDAEAASTNIAQAERAADNLTTKVAAGESDGTAEGENILNAAMVSAANMSVTTEQAVASAMNQRPDAETNLSDAQEHIAKTESLKETVAETATKVENPELTAKMHTAVQDIEAELSRSRDLLTEATDSLAKATDEASEEKPLGQTPQEAEDQAITSPDAFAPGQMDAEAIRQLKEQQDQKQAAAEKATQVRVEQAADEALSAKRAVYS